VRQGRGGDEQEREQRKEKRALTVLKRERWGRPSYEREKQQKDQEKVK